MDFHTHNLQAPAGEAIINIPREWLLSPGEYPLAEGRLYSVGIHPWWTADEEQLSALFEGLERWLSLPSTVALGECGLDRLRGADLSVQEEVFVKQVILAEERGLPLIIHCVKAFDALLRLRKQLRPNTLWTVHGFRGGPELAQQLLDAGFDLSFGAHYNPASYALTPPARRHRETDEDF